MTPKTPKRSKIESETFSGSVLVAKKNAPYLHKVLLLRIKKLRKNGNSTCVFIPADFLEELGWKAGNTKVFMSLRADGSIILSSKAATLREEV